MHAGQRVAVDPLVACGECDQCRAGRKHTCRDQKFLGNPGQLPGALVEYLVMPAACCSPVPDSLNDDQAAVVEPLSIGVYAEQMAQLAPGARVGIVGSGPIGLCTLLAVRARTQAAVYVTDLVDERLAVARACGAAWTGNPRREDVVAAIHRLEPLGLDAVFECAGEQDALDQGIRTPEARRRRCWSSAFPKSIASASTSVCCAGTSCASSTCAAKTNAWSRPLTSSPADALTYGHW